MIFISSPIDEQFSPSKNGLYFFSPFMFNNSNMKWNCLEQINPSTSEIFFKQNYFLCFLFLASLLYFSHEMWHKKCFRKTAAKEINIVENSKMKSYFLLLLVFHIFAGEVFKFFRRSELSSSTLGCRWEIFNKEKKISKIKSSFL